MKKQIKWLVGAVCALALVTTTAVAEDSKVATPAPVPVKTQTDSLFNAGEFGLSIASAYDLGEASQVNGTALFKQPYTLNFNAGAFWYPFRNFGVEASVPFYQSKGVSVNEVQFGVVARLPLAKTTPVFRNVSPYVGVDAAYGWDAAEKWSYVGKAGVEARLNKKWGLFFEGQFRNTEFDNWGQGAVGVNGGLRLVL